MLIIFKAISFFPLPSGFPFHLQFVDIFYSVYSVFVITTFYQEYMTENILVMAGIHFLNMFKRGASVTQQFISCSPEILLQY